MVFNALSMSYIHDQYFGRPSCARCGELMMAPETSGYLSDSNVRHLWKCDECGYRFQTLTKFDAIAA
jgi:primosomal protein N'